MIKQSEQLNILGDQFLVDRLKGVPAAALEGLRKSLLGGDGGRMATGAAVRVMLETAAKRGFYTDGALQVLIAELQAYGGNALQNMHRGSGVAYAEILNETLDHLGLEGVRDQEVEQLEDAVVRQQVRMLWDIRDAELHRKIAESAGVKASWDSISSAMDDVDGMLGLVSFLCGNDYDYEIMHAKAKLPENKIALGVGMATLNPITAIGGKIISKAINDLTPKKLIGKIASVASSHRVTLPCVNQMIRIRLLKEFQGEACIQRAAKKQAPSDVSHLAGGDKVVVMDGSDHDLLSITSVALNAMPSCSKRLDVGNSGISRLSPLFQSIPTIMVANEVSGERFMKVVVNGPLALAKDGNGYRGFVKGVDGKITEHVRLFDGELSQVVNAAALFNVASMALAQKHLADISARLDEIKLGVDKISTFQKRQRESDIRGVIKYLEQIAKPIMDGERRDAIEGRLEDVELQLVKVQDHLKADIEDIVGKVRGARDKGKLGMSSLRDDLAELQVDFDETVQQWKLCLAARMMACRLLCNFPGTCLTVEKRKQSIYEAKDWLLEKDAGVIDQMASNIDSRMAEFTSWYDSSIELQASRETLRINQMAMLPRLEEHALMLSAQFDRLMQDNHRPVELLIAIRDGQVIEAAAL